MTNVVESIRDIGIMPVVTQIDSEADCLALVKALIDGGLPAVEITFRMPHAAACIRAVRNTYPEVVVGAGTVVTVDQAREAIDAGALFLVAPGLNPEIVNYAKSRDVVMFPGVSTASEVEQAMALGLTDVKFFPAEQMGGIATIKALSGPYSKMRFMPTGGLNQENLSDYLNFPKVIACGGTFMFGNALKSKQWDEVTATSHKVVHDCLGLKLAHVGINMDSQDSARNVAGMLADLLRMEVAKDGNSSVFVGSEVEVMKKKGLGACGHIGFSTTNIDRAVRYFRRLGVDFNEDSAKFDAKGNLAAIYFAQEIGGFAIHLLKA